MHPHGVNDANTSDRMLWSDVPATAVAALGEHLGSPVVHAAAPVRSGFGGQFAGVVELADGRTVFVKAAPEALEFPAASLRREGRLLPTLDPEVPHAPLLALIETQGWVLLALEHLVGRMPGQPWTVEDLSAAYDACVVIAGAQPPAEVTASQFRDAVRREDRLIATENDLTTGAFVLPTTYGRDDRLAAIVGARGPQLSELSRSAESLLEGNALCHNDLRPDNMLLTARGAVIVDWNFVSIAPPWLDFVGLLPMAHRQGLDLDPWWRSTLLATASAAQVDAFLATLGVYFLSTQRLPPPPGCTTAARRHQLVYAHDFVRLLAHRRGWAVPALRA